MKTGLPSTTENPASEVSTREYQLNRCATQKSVLSKISSIMFSPRASWLRGNFISVCFRVCRLECYCLPGQVSKIGRF